MASNFGEAGLAQPSFIACQGAVGRAVALPAAVAVDGEARGADLAVPAAAARRVAGADLAAVHRDAGAAVAGEMPVRVAAGAAMREGEPDEPAEAQAGHVDEDLTRHRAPQPRERARRKRGGTTATLACGTPGFGTTLYP